MSKKCYAVIVAGGTGSRMGGGIAKQFLELDDKPVLLHTVEAFMKLSFPVDIILVVPSAYRQHWKDYCMEHRLTFSHILVSGGITRFHSVKNALKYVAKDAIVAVHDGVRPFVSKDFLESLFALAQEREAVIPVIKAVDSIRKLTGEGSSKPVNRKEFVMVQTPQIFHSDIILKAYEQAYSPLFNDDASVVESIGQEIFLAEGSRYNIKITQPEDLILARAIINVF
ncbi:MAG: 2-C-methyl-D-erythritol 4-phosphate cytidylyltransferase [Bacteroidales bacterium]